jgi:hypothetical protein
VEEEFPHLHVPQGSAPHPIASYQEPCVWLDGLHGTMRMLCCCTLQREQTR